MTLTRTVVAALLAAIVVALYWLWPLLRAAWTLKKGLGDIHARLDAQTEAESKTEGALVEQIASGSALERRTAALALRERGLESPASIARLSELLDARRKGVRAAAAAALGGAGDRARPHVSRVVAAMRDAEGEAQEAILAGLGQIGGLDEEAIARVLDVMRGASSDEVRARAAEAFASLRIDAPAVREALCDALRTDPSVGVRMWCAVALGWLAPDEAGTQALEHARDHEAEPSLRSTAEEALTRRANFAVRAEETPEEAASAEAFAPGDRLFDWGLNVVTFVGLGERRDHLGLQRRSLRVKLATGVVVDLPLACVGLKRLATLDEARAIIEANFATRAEREPSDGLPACRLPEILAELGRDDPEPWAHAELERLVQELAHVLGRDERELRALLAARHPTLRARIEGGAEPSRER